MMNVVVVDDKKLIRKGMMALLAKSGLELGSVAEFGNGHDALEYLRTTAVDLVITDIRMPAMDGITLMEHARKLEPAPKFIVLSEFDDFKYAQKSIEHGAKAYMLKPVDKIELVQVMSKVEAEINREKGIHQKEDQMIAKEKRLMKEELRLALLNSIHSDGVTEKLEQQGFPFGSDPFYVSLILFTETEFPQGSVLLHSGLHEAMREHADGSSGPHFMLELGRTSMMITQSSNQVSELVLSINRDEKRCVAAISDLCTSSRKLREGYLQALEALKYRYLYPEQAIVRYVEIAGLRADTPLPTEEIDKLCLLIGTGKMAAINAQVSTIFNKSTIVGSRIEYMEGTVKAFYNSLTSMAGVLAYKWSDELRKYDNLRDIYHFDSMKDYLASAMEFVHMIDNYIASMKSAYRHNIEIDKAIEYMENNYDKDISLTTVSNYVSMNYSYFSHLFRAKTGVSFVEYLRKIRINKSMELLTDSRLKISDISDKVGFNSYKHFSRSFFEVVGISPIEFREKKMMMEKMLEENTSR